MYTYYVYKIYFIKCKNTAGSDEFCVPTMWLVHTSDWSQHRRTLTKFK